jgi:phosphate-selective porin
VNGCRFTIHPVEAARINSSDGMYILGYQKHFIACRRVDQNVEVNFSHRRHLWREARVDLQGTAAVAEAFGQPVSLTPGLLDGVFEIRRASEESPGLYMPRDFLFINTV